MGLFVKSRGTAIVCFLLAGQLLVAGEVSYQETTTITGGTLTTLMKFAGNFNKDARAVGQPVVTTVAVKGNRMLRETNDTADITDLDAQTITHIDKLKHEYSVITFAQMKAAAEQAMQKARAQMQQSNAPTQPEASQPAKDPNVQVSFDAHVRKTGATKQVSGLDTAETILTVTATGTDKTTGQQAGLAFTNDMWMAPEIPAYAVVADFEKKLALAMGKTFVLPGPDLTPMLHQPQSSGAMDAMAKEMSQIHGVPVLQILRMGMTADGKPLPAASEAPLPQQSAGGSLADAAGTQVTTSAANAAERTAAQETSSKIRGALGSSLGGALGGFGGFGRKKKQQPPAQEAAPAPASSTQPANANAAAAVLLESSTEIGHFTDHVDPALLQVPAGFNLITAPELKQ